ncbi:MAG: hypothetical protein RBT59_08835 [Arcobacteraceae bacterium]|jgi:hypothetical protein|nr:hypothetical protein [Arcobacteraceae bacterium]
MGDKYILDGTLGVELVDLIDVGLLKLLPQLQSLEKILSEKVEMLVHNLHIHSNKIDFRTQNLNKTSILLMSTLDKFEAEFIAEIETFTFKKVELDINKILDNNFNINLKKLDEKIGTLNQITANNKIREIIIDDKNEKFNSLADRMELSAKEMNERINDLKSQQSQPKNLKFSKKQLLAAATLVGFISLLLGVIGGGLIFYSVSAGN